MSHAHERRWAVILAAGEGTRMASLTRALYGVPVPKQYARLHGDRTLLQATVDRLAPLVQYHRMVVVIASNQEALARRQLEPYPGIDIVVQPENVGTGPGVMLPLARVMARDPDARVIVSPSDHHVSRPLRFLEAMAAADDIATRSGSDRADCSGGRVTLLGVAPDRPASDLGWIMPGQRLSSQNDAVGMDVASFVEKPAESTAFALLRAGGLWNTLVLVSRVRAFWSMMREHLPRQSALFEDYASQVDSATEEACLRAIYHNMPPADLSRDVLERAAGLAVVPIVDSGWSDWGTPERLFQSLEGTPHLEPLLRQFRISPLSVTLRDVARA